MSSGGLRDDPLSFINPSSSPAAVATDGDGYLIDAGGLSGSYQNDGLLAGGDSGSSSDAEFGFSRPEFGQEVLAGTVQMYERHVFLCYKNPQVWPAHVQNAEFDRLPRLLSAAVLARKGDMKRKTRLTICEGHDGSETSNGDILIFPDMVTYRRLTHFDVDTFVEEVLVKDNEWHPGTPELLDGWYVFVCCHGSRDKRCGVCGPALVTKFKDEIDAHGLQGQVSVSPCSHIGGHKYAGNVIIFGPRNGKVQGHWYGYVAPDDVWLLLEQHIGKGEIVDQLWRGQMGLSEDEQKKAQQHRIESRIESGLEETSKGSAEVDGDKTNTSGCCQENESSCCQNQNPDPGVQIRGSNVTEDTKSRASEKKGSGKESKANGKVGANGSRKTFTTQSWIENWEREDTYAALAVVGAIASIAIAYSCYRQSR
ncbi:hypothetical protein H6P81_008540 [Aristolochia fimbriata]|uniref:Sucrase n=1 Tax=Aristolochia fimbriata TaxID=158543 RepID=A0AAV7EI97_ARIFI|nr:hypothetical protein H6P81_008540 [Aristolochia fimbriata]